MNFEPRVSLKHEKQVITACLDQPCSCLEEKKTFLYVTFSCFQVVFPDPWAE